MELPPKQQPPGEDTHPTLLDPAGITASNRVPGWGFGLNTMQLTPGARLFEYEVTGTIGQGGFGIVYRAIDRVLQREVAIKEYLPASMALRTDKGAVTLASQAHAGAFEAGLSSFVNEARLLAQFDHPALVKVFRFWEANGTAYMVMPLYEGLTLKQHLQEHPNVSQRWLENLLQPLLDALETLHQARVFHRDIAPDNILVLKDGRPLLLDFGAARQRIGEMTHGMTVIVKPGYAPIEQYTGDASARQGPWTDIYALAAVMYYAVTHTVPAPSVSRVVEDTLVPLARNPPDGFTPRFLEALDRGLRIEHKQRPQSVPEFRKLLYGDRAPPVASEKAKRELPRMSRKWQATAIGLAIVTTLSIGGLAWRSHSQKSGPERAQSSEPKSVAQTPSPDAQPRLRVEPPPPPQPPPAARAPFSAVSALHQVAIAGNAGLQPRVTVVTPRAVADRDQAKFNVTAPADGYLYVLMYDTDGKLYLLFPNAIDNANRIAANQPTSLPRQGWSIVATPPLGTNRLLAILSSTPRDFTAAGLVPAGDFNEIILDTAGRAYAAHQDSWPLLAGRPVCDRPCSSEFGAAEFNIEVVRK